jgi:GntR family carbon starvation induced transcriptional regulator
MPRTTAPRAQTGGVSVGTPTAGASAVQQLRPDAPGTRADWVDRRLRSAILTGELAPGEKLVAGPLAARFAVSATPLREAIQRLAASGLVEIEPQRGARVAAASAREAEEIYELRALLDPLALRDSLAHSDDAHLAAIDAAFAQLERADAARGDLVDALERHAAFHAALVARCRSRWLLRLTTLLADHSQRYAFLAIGTGATDGHHDALAEHRALRDAAHAGDPDAAAALLRDHLQRTLSGTRARLTRQPRRGTRRASRRPASAPRRSTVIRRPRPPSHGQHA